MVIASSAKNKRLPHLTAAAGLLAGVWMSSAACPVVPSGLANHFAPLLSSEVSFHTPQGEIEGAPAESARKPVLRYRFAVISPQSSPNLFHNAPKKINYGQGLTLSRSSLVSSSAICTSAPIKMHVCFICSIIQNL